jgi:hypothetical protein
MHDKHREWVELLTNIALERLRAKSERTFALLRRSYEQIEKSKELLKIEVPRVWPPKPPRERERERERGKAVLVSGLFSLFDVVAG